ncbi:MAG: carbamoyltransferase HypF [Polyangia bacterium]
MAGSSDERRGLGLRIEGAVQGVGFRPFVFRLAQRLGLGGHVRNTGDAVELEVEGDGAVLAAFERDLTTEAPPAARLVRITTRPLPARGVRAFTIAASHDRGGERTGVALQPDAATCAPCLAEVLSPRDRRSRYPFTTCDACGPRYTVAERLPFDRAGTTLRDFPMCADCAREYADPASRRFHAQTITCPACGPQLSLRAPSGELLAEREAALQGAAAALQRGEIVAALGLGGYHLLVDASSERAVQRLRARKRRPHKPLAVMAASLDQAEELARLDDVSAQLLGAPAAPIVLVPGRARLAPSVAPALTSLGVVLAHTPLHHLLLGAVGRPLVATSGNLSDEPLCTEAESARQRLGAVADLFLDHDRRIARPLDDSVVQVVGGRSQLLRRGRGFVPASLPLPTGLGPIEEIRRPRLGLGAHLKSALALAAGARLHLGEHLGTLGSARTRAHLVEQAAALPALLGLQPAAIGLACDAHPGYFSTELAEGADPGVRRVQHHHAHALAALCDAGDAVRQGPVLAAVWDGGGDGTDGTIWGGELLALGPDGSCTRVASLRPFPLPGGEQAVREPRRAALGLLYALRGPALFQSLPPSLRALFSETELRLLRDMLARGVNAPVCSSVGRLFDAVAALCGVRATSTYEGQAAMELEALATDAAAEPPYPIALAAARLDWAPLVEAVLHDRGSGVSAAQVAARLHRGLSQALVRAALQAGGRDVLLTGGVFQNRLLSEEAVRGLRAAGLTPHWPQHVPPSDGGIAVGQALYAVLRDRQQAARPVPDPAPDPIPKQEADACA